MGAMGAQCAEAVRWASRVLACAPCCGSTVRVGGAHSARGGGGSGGGGRARSRRKRCAVGESVAAPAQVAPCGTGCAVQEGSWAGEERARLRHRWCGSGGNDAPCACSCAWHPGSARHLKLRLGQQNPCITQHAACCGRQCTRRGKGHPRRRADGASARGGGSARRDWPWAGHGGQESTCACARREALLVAKRTRDRSRRGLSQREHFTRYK